MIRIAVIDDHLVVLAGIKALLTRKYGMEVVATSDNPAETVEIVRQHRRTSSSSTSACRGSRDLKCWIPFSPPNPTRRSQC